MHDPRVMPADRPVIGIFFMVGFCAFAPLSDATLKLLGETIPLLEVLVVRFAVQALLILPLVCWGGRSLALTPRVLWLTALRTVLQILGLGAMFASLRFLPLAEAVAIAYVMPFILLLLGRMVLKEEVGPRRLAACVVGFIGTLLVIQPSFSVIGAPALLPLVVAVVFSLYILVTRQIARDADPVVLQGVSGLMGTVGLAVLFVMTAGSELPGLGMVTPNGTEVLMLIAVGVLGTLSHLLMTWSLRFAPSATLAPIQYLEIPFATLIGWLIFRDLPNGLAAAGIVVTVAAGLYIVYRERLVVEPVPQES
ncbi:DMT family transporter [Chelativorans salis]|uniref:DMT family transporter n=1 Tax=Chelativorans salis TaxID=2978478 RepID=A0ABT2LJQ6_9HYPH|nr:DMT family transporter [Chelativorans sp. EGI FJ00035]MCT7373918.1 DMT family transporter [Chelativorans sp. EGI FJ00035]